MRLARQFNTATSKKKKKKKIHRMTNVGDSVQGDEHTPTHTQITNETLNVNGRTRAINLSAAAGQQGSGSRPSCQNGTSVRTEIVIVVEEIQRHARGELAPSWCITFSNNEMQQTGSILSFLGGLQMITVAPLDWTLIVDK